LEIALRINAPGVPDELALNQLFAWAHRLEHPDTAAAKTEKSGTPASDLLSLYKQVEADMAGGVVVGGAYQEQAEDTGEDAASEAAGEPASEQPKKRRGRMSNADKAALAAAGQPVPQPVPSLASVMPPGMGAPLPTTILPAAPQTDLSTPLPVAVVPAAPPAAPPISMVPPAAAALLPTTPPAAPPAAPPVPTFPDAQVAAMPVVPPGPRAQDVTGHPSLEDIRACMLDLDKRAGIGKSFQLLKSKYNVFMAEKVPPERRLEAMMDAQALLAGA
jgi:hypothetical protein